MLVLDVVGASRQRGAETTFLKFLLSILRATSKKDLPFLTTPSMYVPTRGISSLLILISLNRGCSPSLCFTFDS